MSLEGPWAPLGSTLERQGPSTDPRRTQAGREQGPRVPRGIKGGDKQGTRTRTDLSWKFCIQHNSI